MKSLVIKIRFVKVCLFASDARAEQQTNLRQRGKNAHALMQSAAQRRQNIRSQDNTDGFKTKFNVNYFCNYIKVLY